MLTFIVHSIKMMEFQRANLVQLFSNQPEDDCGIIWGCSSFIIESISDKAAGAAFHCYFIRFLESSPASLIVEYEVGKGLEAVYLNLEPEREGELWRCLTREWRNKGLGENIETLPKALRTQALTALTSSFGLIWKVGWYIWLAWLRSVWFNRFSLVGFVWQIWLV